MASIDAPALDFLLTFDFVPSTPGGISRPGPLIEFTLDLHLDAQPLVDPGPDIEWEARLVDKDDNLVALLPNATFDTISRTHNAPVRVSGVRVPASDPATSTHLSSNDIHELQWWWGRHLVHWGPYSRPQLRDGEYQFESADPLAYLERRIVGDAADTNLLADPDFAEYPWLDPYSAWGDWYIHKVNRGGGSVVVDYSEFYPVTEPRLPGSVRSFQLSNDDNDADVYLSLLQSGDVTAGDFDLEVAFVAYVQLGAEPASHTATQGHGMALGMYTGSLSDYQTDVWPTPLDMQTDGSLWEETSTAVIDPADFPREEWVRLQTSVTVPAGETRLIIADISCPDGEKLTIAQRPRLVTSEGLEYKNTDIAQVIAGLVDHAQDTTFGKTSVSLGTGVATGTTTGIKVDRNYPYAEHQNIWRAITEFTSETVDVWCQVSQGGRSLHIGNPRGTYKGLNRLQVHPEGGNCVLLDWTSDTERAANKLIHFGAGSGIGRDVGYAQDQSAHSGITLEEVTYSDPLSTVGHMMLKDRAETRLETLAEPEVLHISIPPRSDQWRYIKYISPGDWVPVSIYLLASDNTTPVLNLAADYRVVTVTLKQSNEVILELNRRDVPDALL